MNDDASRLKQVDRLLEQGHPSDNEIANRLAWTQPMATKAFQQDLEQMLMDQLIAQTANQAKETSTMTRTSTLRLPRTARAAHFPALTSWGVALAAIFLCVLLLLNRSAGWLPTGATATQITADAYFVIATQDIPSGTVISAEMIGTVTLTEADMAEIRGTQPDRTFLSDETAIVGQTAAVDIFWLQPIEAELLGEPVDVCNLPNAYCPEVPEGYWTIGFPLESDTLQGLQIGDRVDVLAAVDGQLRVMVANVLLADVRDGMVTLAAPSWQHSILIWLYTSGASYALRQYTGDVSAVATLDAMPTEYTFTAPEPLPDGYVFDLIVELPAARGYLLTGLRASINNIEFTGPDNRLNFWFKNLEVVSIVEGTTVTIRLPAGDAANLDYLINQGAELTFLPDAG